MFSITRCFASTSHDATTTAADCEIEDEDD